MKNSEEYKCYIVMQRPKKGSDPEYYKSKKDWIKSGKYFDPDVEENRSFDFYRKLTMFLNAQEKLSVKLEKRYIYRFNQTKPYGIEVREEIQGKISEPIFYLKSDQFGFSAPKSSDELKEHPYDTFIRLNNNSDDAKEDVLSWLYETRGLGGSFLWPMEYDGRGGCIENPQYNFARGGRRGSALKGKGNYWYHKYYIEDRVDLTLNEIKQVLDYIDSDQQELQGNILWKYCLPKTNMVKWLRHFRDFETYVEFFKFENFVDKDKNFIPYDITTNNKNKKDENIIDIQRYKGEKRPRKIWTGNDGDMNVKQLEDMFDYLSEKIKQRSGVMEKCIKNSMKKL